MADLHTVAVLGGGSFGTVIGNIVACNGSRVRLWLRNETRAAGINEYRENRDYLPGYRLSDNLSATVDLQEALAGAALELGENSVGMLLTRSLAEMSRFAVHMGANPMTFLGLSGVGDLFVTPVAQLSRGACSWSWPAAE